MNIQKLRKCYWPEIQELSLRNHHTNVDENKITEGYELAKMKIPEVINLEYNKSRTIQCNDISWILKSSRK